MPENKERWERQRKKREPAKFGNPNYNPPNPLTAEDLNRELGRLMDYKRRFVPVGLYDVQPTNKPGELAVYYNHDDLRDVPKNQRKLVIQEKMRAQLKAEILAGFNVTDGEEIVSVAVRTADGQIEVRSVD